MFPTHFSAVCRPTFFVNLLVQLLVGFVFRQDVLFSVIPKVLLRAQDHATRCYGVLVRFRDRCLRLRSGAAVIVRVSFTLKNSRIRSCIQRLEVQHLAELRALP